MIEAQEQWRGEQSRGQGPLLGAKRRSGPASASRSFKRMGNPGLSYKRGRPIPVPFRRRIPGIDPTWCRVYMRTMLSITLDTIPILIAPHPILKAKAKPVGQADDA